MTVHPDSYKQEVPDFGEYPRRWFRDMCFLVLVHILTLLLKKGGFFRTLPLKQGLLAG
jgi:hypothetical protein